MKTLDNKSLFKLAALKAGCVFAYIFLVSLFISNAQKLFGQKDNKFLTPILVLLLFVLSSLITGYLILGKSLMLYLDNEKKASLKLLFYIGLCLTIILLMVGVVLYIVK